MTDRPTLVNLSEVTEREIVDGFFGKMIHTATMTMAYWSVNKDALLPEHQHPHEQVLNLLEGEFELQVQGKTHHLMPGSVFVIPGNVPHSGRAITPCRILDVFQPTRDDYR
ncbi:MAG: cupin domain-containing protein [Planctomycetaceae bacterium]|nr:cupin domain-containing protein [Planctomycetaceae bacterium]MCP4477221.1 cupin domain-containing protein [Planctomycetaceae bacterium]